MATADRVLRKAAWYVMAADGICAQQHVHHLFLICAGAGGGEGWAVKLQIACNEKKIQTRLTLFYT